MNKEILKQYHVEFYRRSDGGRFLNLDRNWLSTYIYTFRDIEITIEFIEDLNLALNGNFSQIGVPDWSVTVGEYWYAHITPYGFEIWQDGLKKTVIPLLDMLEIMISWKEFLEL